MHKVHCTSSIDRSGRPTGTHGLSVGDGRPTSRPKEEIGRPGQSTDRRICFSWCDSDFISEKESNPIGFPKTMRLSDINKGVEPSWIISLEKLVFDHWINKISLSYSEDIGKMSNLVKYCVCFLSCYLFLSLGTSLLRLSLLIEVPQLGYCKVRVTSSIRASQVRHGIVCRFQEHWLLFGGNRVSISEQRWDCLWDHVSISKQHVGLLKESNLVE